MQKHFLRETIKKIVRSNSFKLLTLLVPFVLGLIGYSAYYADRMTPEQHISIQSNVNKNTDSSAKQPSSVVAEAANAESNVSSDTVSFVEKASADEPDVTNAESTVNINADSSVEQVSTDDGSKAGGSTTSNGGQNSTTEEKKPVPVMPMPVYSTLRLFTMAYDGAYFADCNPYAWYFIVLAFARWLAVFATGTALFRLLRSPLLRSWNGFTYDMRKRMMERQIFVIGNNEENRAICTSAGKGQFAMILCDSEDDQEIMRNQYIPYLILEDPAEITKEICEQISWSLRKNKYCTLIINTHNEERNLLLSRKAVECLQDFIREDKASYDHLKQDASTQNNVAKQEEMLALEKKLAEVFGRLQVIVFGNRENQGIYLDLERESLGILKYTNKYQLTAIDFVQKHPLTENMHLRQSEDGCVPDDLYLHVILVGFGDTNQELFTASVATNQFIVKMKDGLPKLKKVKYHIFDREENWNDKNLNHSMFRYVDDFRGAIKRGSIKGEDYLELPPDPAEIHMHRTDTNGMYFYEEVLHTCARGAKDINYLVIAHGSDLENIDLAQRMAAKKREWGLSNLYIFVRVRNTDNAALTRNLSNPDYQVFGNEKEVIFNLSQILKNEIENMAFQRSLMYELESLWQKSNPAIKTDEDARLHALFSWHTMDLDRRVSNIYDVLSIRMKLQLMGLDYIRKPLEGNTVNRIASNDDYFDIYAAGDMPKKRMDISQIKEVYSYDFIRPAEHYMGSGYRRNLTIQEHYRWNAYMFTCGFIPATRKAILSGKVKDYALRTHGNLTTFEGLFEYRKMMAEKKKTAEKDEDVIKYDYQIMDDAWWLLNENGYDMVKR